MFRSRSTTEKSSSAAPVKVTIYSDKKEPIVNVIDGKTTITPEERHKMIETLAYFMAEKRDFAPGHEMEDWLNAEKQIDQAIGFRDI